MRPNHLNDTPNKLTDILNPNKFENCELKPGAALNKSFLSIPFLWDAQYINVAIEPLNNFGNLKADGSVDQKLNCSWKFRKS